MNSKLRIQTERKEQNDVGEEQPVSPTAQYFNSKSFTSCILGILEFDVPIDVSRLMPLVQNVFLPINPRFSSIMVTDKGGVRRWKRVEVNFQDHIKIPCFPEGLSVQEYDNHFDEYLSNISMELLPEDKPLWEIHLITYPTSKAAGIAVLNIHHSLGDGYSMMSSLLSCLQRADDPSLPLTFPSIRKRKDTNDSSDSLNVISRVMRNLHSIYNGMCDIGWSFAKSTWSADDKTPIRSGSQGVGYHPPVNISTVTFSLVKLKQIKTKLAVTMNAVLTGVIFYGARLYMQRTGEGFGNSRSTAIVALNTRNINSYMTVEEMLKPDTKMWGNKFAFLHVPLPELTSQNSPNPLDFVSEAHKLIMMKKFSPAVYLTSQFLEIVRKFRGSEAAAGHVLSALENSSLGFTSMIGPVEQMSLANHRVKGLYFTVVGLHLSLVISATSYMQTLRIGIGAEKGFIDSKKFKSCIEEAFERIYEDAAIDSTP